MILLLVLTPGTVITDRHILFTKQGSVFIVILLNTLFQNFFFHNCPADRKSSADSELSVNINSSLYFLFTWYDGVLC